MHCQKRIGIQLNKINYYTIHSTLGITVQNTLKHNCDNKNSCTINTL